MDFASLGQQPLIMLIAAIVISILIIKIVRSLARKIIALVIIAILGALRYSDVIGDYFATVMS